MMRIFFLAVVCVSAAACGRAGALTKPPDYIAPPPAKNKISGASENKLSEILDKIRAPQENSKPPQQKKQQEQKQQ